MCGIVGSINQENVVPELLNSLGNIEYRGYDSAGVSVLTAAGITTKKRPGKLETLRSSLDHHPIIGNIGIGHTRWATHGEPNKTNAHPHSNDDVAVVHNGIIENHRHLRSWLESEGFIFQSQTDTEVIPHLISHFLAQGCDPDQAMHRALQHLEGAFALGVLFKLDQEHLYAARRGSPLVLGKGDLSACLGSDSMALTQSADKILYLEEGDQARIGINTMELVDLNGHKVTRQLVDNDDALLAADKQNHHHYMHKEIHEQPIAINKTLFHTQQEIHDIPIDFTNISRLSIIACGTSYYAAMVAKYWFEQFAQIPVDVDIASEFRYRQPIMAKDGLALFISQSGETADTLAALSYANAKFQKTLAITNVANSSIARMADHVIQTQAGPEIGVASTKAFTTQLTVLATLAVKIGFKKQLFDIVKASELCQSLAEVPAVIESVLALEEEFKAVGDSLKDCQDAFFIGRGSSYPIAMEGALKLKEISYIHAEGFGAGELKHGPIALIEKDVPVFVIAPNDGLIEKTQSNMEEVISRGGRCILIGDEVSTLGLESSTTHCLTLPKSNELISPIIYVVALQLIAYYAALAKGTDVDQPRNLAKSVTVE